MADPMNLGIYLDALAAKTSAPGGGFVAAISLAQAAALASMVANFTKNEDWQQELKRIADIRVRALQLAYADETAFQQVMQAYKGKDPQVLDTALKNAIAAPREVIELAQGLSDFVETLAVRGNRNLLTDAGIAASLIESAIRSSELNILVNLQSLDDKDYINSLQEFLNSGVAICETMHQLSASIREAMRQSANDKNTH